jgi:hypothetical protein
MTNSDLDRMAHMADGTLPTESYDDSGPDGQMRAAITEMAGQVSRAAQSVDALAKLVTQLFSAQRLEE